jgi:hypothetical protein
MVALRRVMGTCGHSLDGRFAATPATEAQGDKESALLATGDRPRERLFKPELLGGGVPGEFLREDFAGRVGVDEGVNW